MTLLHVRGAGHVARAEQGCAHVVKGATYRGKRASADTSARSGP
jgi:hypothetical protein